jgi:hypothetical protein
MADPYFSEQKDPESLHPSLRGKSSFALSTNLSFIELSAHGLVEMSEENGILDEQSLPPWLSKVCRTDELNHESWSLTKNRGASSTETQLTTRLRYLAKMATNCREGCDSCKSIFPYIALANRKDMLSAPSIINLDS